jgi:hypothetical protein
LLFRRRLQRRRISCALAGGGALGPLSDRSLDNLPDPTSSGSDTYVPTNRPTVGDMFDLFDFHNAQAATAAPPSPHGGQRTSGTVERVPQLAR